MIGARTLGLAHYFQHHVDRCQGEFWPRLSGIEYDCLEGDQIDAVSEPTFSSKEDQRTAADSIAFKALWKDEQNFLEKSFLYSTEPGNSKTYVDGIEDGVLNGAHNFVKLMIWVKKRDGVDINVFRDYMSNNFAPSIVKSNFVLKLRLHLLEEYNAAMWNSPHVIHDRTPEQQYQACFEIGFLDRFEMRRFFTSAEYAATTQAQLKHIQTIHAFPERETYTFVRDGKLTLAGQRSYSVAETIRMVGAVNQIEDNVASLFFKQV